ncbi:MAG: hypothetical protein NC395_09230 [Prevotella sp.]|nr:hypothetical protein [Prevotella sp.]
MKMYFSKKSVRAAAEKIINTALIFCCAAAMTFTASAVSGNEIKLEANGSEAALELYFPQAAAEETASMQLSVSVNAGSDAVNVEFIPDGGLSSKIVESRYQSNTGTLNIYLAGTEALFPADGYLTVGKVKITSANGSGAATLDIVKDSVKFVRGGELVSPDGTIDYPVPVSISSSGQSVSGGTGGAVTERPDYPSYPVYPVYPNYPAVNGVPETLPSVTDNGAFPAEADGERRDDAAGGEDILPDTQEIAEENGDPPDTSDLQDALSRADGYRKSDYSESSYDDLAEAAENAKEVLSDPAASQDEVDEALLDIENAIGMLTLGDDIPSGAEGYGENHGAGAGTDGGNGEYPTADYGENGMPIPDVSERGDGSSDVLNADLGETAETDAAYADASANGDMPSENSGVSDSKNSPAVLLAIIAAAVIAAAAAVVIIKLKKKPADGNQNKD